MNQRTPIKPYPAYKPSGIEWIGDVPKHWTVRRLKQACRFAYGDTLTSEMRREGCVPVLGSNGQVGVHYVANTKAPCVIIGRKGSFGKVNYVDTPAFAIDTTYFVDERYTQNDLRWLFYLLGSIGLDGVTRDSAIPGLNRQDAYERLIPLPPLPEQRAIARYLDYMDRRIQRYIKAKERLIGLLEEQKRAVINQAVTRGLDLDVPLKASGVEWLGDVPAHWEVRRLKHCGSATIGLTYNPSDVVTEDEGILVLRASNVQNGRIVYEDCVYVNCEVPEKLIVRAGDILICSRSGSRDLVGKNAQIDASSQGVTYGAFMTVFRSTHNEFLHQVFNSELFPYHLGAFSTSTVNQLTLEILYGLRVPFPPVDERCRIVEFLRDKTKEIDQQIGIAVRQIELIKEYRTRLIADVVTGKLDVREVAATLPGEAGDDEDMAGSGYQHDSEPVEVS